jgi:tetratricopeptide (TPR) repeat protein
MKKRKLLIFLSVLTVCLIVFIIRFLTNGSFRKQLPELPDLETVSKSVRKQIISETRKAFLYTSSKNLGKLGMVYHSCAYYEKADKCYQLALKKNSSKWIWSYYLGYLNLELGDSNAANENFRYVVNLDPGNFMALYYIAETSRSLGFNDISKNFLQKIISLNSNDIDQSYPFRDNYFPLQTYAKFRLARILMNEYRLDSAEVILNKLIEDQPKFGPAYRLLGNLYTTKGDLSLGERYNILANDLADYTPPIDVLSDKIVLISRSEEYLLKNIEESFRIFNFEWALKLCDHALKFVPDSKFLISKSINGYLLYGDGKKALKYLNRHIWYFGKDFNELMHVADLLYSKGFTSQAMMYFNTAKKLDPINPSLTLWLAERGMTKDAIILLDQQLKEQPENIRTLVVAADILLNLGLKERAKDNFASLKRLAPMSPEVKMLAGTIIEKDGDINGSLMIYEEIFRNNPKDLVIAKYLANFYIRNNMVEKAITHFKCSLNNFPNDPFFLEGLGRILIFCPDQKLRDLRDGMEYSERAYNNFRSSFATKISAGRNMAIAYAELGNKEKAFTILNNTINLARKSNASSDYLHSLENLLKQFSPAN